MQSDEQSFSDLAVLCQEIFSLFFKLDAKLKRKLPAYFRYAESDPLDYNSYYKQLLSVRHFEQLDSRWIEAIQRSNKMLERLHRAVIQSGSRLYLIIIPFPTQVGPLQWGEGRRKFGYSEIHSGTVMQSHMKQFCEEKNIPCIDLLLPFQKEGTTKKLFFDLNGHFNEVGSRLVAQVVYKHIARNRSCK